MQDSTSSVADNKALVTAYLEAFSSGDVNRIGAYLHEDLRWWVTGTVPGISGTYDNEYMDTQHVYDTFIADG